MTDERKTPDRNLLSSWTPWIVVIVIVAAGMAAYAIWSESHRDRKDPELPPSLVYDVDRYRTIPAERIGYEEVASFAIGLTKATALCVGPGDEIVVGGDTIVLVHGPGGDVLHTFPTEGTPLAMAASRDGLLYVGFANRVMRGTLGGPLAGLITIPGKRARVTSVAVDADAVYVADAGSRSVLRYSLRGQLLGRIGDRDPARNIPGFNVPSPYFDLLVAPDGLLRIVDPGRHRINAFTTGGDLEFSWGQASFNLPGFGGCCNPSHIALLPNGNFVTSEKGIPRVKVHDAEGDFVTAVVGADGLSTDTKPCEVATDSRGRILLLDPGARVVRIFEEKKGDGR